MTEIETLQATIAEQVKVQKELTLAEAAKAAAMEKQAEELEKNNLIRVEHNKFLNELITQIHHIIAVINRWDESNYFESIFHLLEIIIPILANIDSREQTIEILKNVATNIGKRDVHISKVQGTNIGLGEEINFGEF